MPMQNPPPALTKSGREGLYEQLISLRTAELRLPPLWGRQAHAYVEVRLIGLLYLAHFLEHFVGCLESIQAGGNAAIDGCMKQHFLDLFDRDAVVDRAARVQLDLRRAVERRQHGQVQHAAG